MKGRALISLLLLICVPLVTVLTPSSPRAAPKVDEEPISFAMPDGVKLPGRIYKPAGPGPFPTVLILHGAGGVPDEFFEWATALAREGMAAIVYARRGYALAAGSGDRDAARQIKKNSDEVLLVVEQVRKLPLVEGAAVGLLGHSEGGMYAYIASYREPDVRAAVGIAGIPDFVAHYAFVKKNFPTYPIPWMKSSPGGIAQAIGCQPEACQDRYQEISALYNADKVQVPVLIIAAKRDLWTPGEASARFAEALKAAGKPYEFYDYDEGHLFFAFTSPEWVFQRGPIVDWLRPQLWSKKNARDAWAKVVTFLTAHLKK
jgi:dienelactone hydrolase